jgi:hypothetical protein
VWDPVSDPCKTISKIMVSHILNFKFLDRWREDKGLWIEW